MVSISYYKRTYKRSDGSTAKAETYSAQIRWTKPVRASIRRDTGATTLREAQKIGPVLAKKWEEEELPLLNKPRHTLEGMFSTWIIEHGKDLRSGKDISWQIRLLIELMGSKTPIANISNAAVHDFVMTARERGKSDIVVNRCLTRLRATLRYAAKKWDVPTQAERIDWSAHFAREPDEKEMYLSPDEARRLIIELPAHIGLAFAFSYYTGARLGEVEALTWDRVNLAQRVAVVETKSTGKSPKFRQLRLSSRALMVLRRLEVTAGEDHTPVFDLTNRRKHWEKARAAIGREDVTWHGIRHTTATEAGRHTASDKTIGKLLGHTPGSRATQRYLHVMDDSVFDALNTLPDIGMPGGEK